MSLLSLLFKPDEPTQAADMLDLVVRTASLVSRPREVDTLLDKVRVMSSRLKPGEPLSPDQEKQLALVYLQLERYLMTKEPLREFKREELRQRIQDERLKAMLDKLSLSA